MATHQGADRATGIVERTPMERQTVAIKAYDRIAREWRLRLAETAALADMPLSTWKNAREPDWRGTLGRDQMLRLSAVIGIYKALELYFSGALAREWVTLPNAGQAFAGARPLDAMIEGGLPKILQVRAYLDALRGGA